MTITPNNKNIVEIKYEDKSISKIYYEDKLVYKKPEYTLVTAIVASNTNQWIDTGVGKGLWTNDITWESKASFSEVNAAIFGQRAAQKLYHCDAICSDSSNRWQYRSTKESDTLAQLNNTKHSEFNVPHLFVYSGDDKFYVDGDIYTSSSSWTDNIRNFCLKDTFHLFRINQFYDTSMTYCDKGVRTIYYIKMWYRGKLIINYIPVLDKDNIPCFFDKVTQQFIYSAGPEPLEYIE